jgi:hypothetical protein
MSQLQALPHRQLSTASKVKVASTSTSDSVTGTGARVVLIAGLDNNFDVQEEIILMNGQTPVESQYTYSRMLEMTCLQFGANVDSKGDSMPVGDIFCGTGTFTLGVPQYPITGIDVSEYQVTSRVGIYTVPANKIAILRSIFCTTTPDMKDDTSLILQLAIRLYGFPENLWFKTSPYVFNGSFQYLPEFVIPFPSRTDFQVRCATTNAKSKLVQTELVFELQDVR